jgi:antitoxin (DNA-binding transcriptional repressor) of toxin-antitoxin stability system
MTATVEQTQSDLAGMIRLAVGGEEIVITQAGQPVAKLTAISRPVVALDREQWLKSLRELRESANTGKPGRSSDEILAEDRAERL